MLLTGCDLFEPKIVERPVPVAVYVPDELRNCPNLPAVPPRGATQKSVANYVAALHQVAKTCKVKLDKVDDILLDQELTFAVPPSGG